MRERKRHGLLFALIVVATSCEGKLATGPDARSDALHPGLDARHDAGGDRQHAERRLADGPRAPDLPVADATAGCAPIPGSSYGKLAPKNPYPGDISKHGDVNLLLRKKQAVSETKGLVDVGGATDGGAPQLYSLFADDRVPGFPTVYQVEAWDWGCNCPKGWIADPKVTLAGMKVAQGELIQTPKSGYDLGGGYTVIVLYAAKDTITLKYTLEDDVVKGYTVHLSGICVEPGLQALYDSLNASGRKELPALKGRQPLGRATGSEIQAAIRDTGSWMDPRVRKDWWQGK